MPRLSQVQFHRLRDRAFAAAGIVLPDYKRNMVQRRLTRRLSALGLTEFAPYLAVLAGPEGAAELESFVNALTTNKTSFFREPHHFEHLAKVALPQLRQEIARHHGRTLRIWSAGCSSGEEPYSIAMTLAEASGFDCRWTVKLLATDIDTGILQLARAGRYPAEDLGQLPMGFKARYCVEGNGSDGGEISAGLRQRITFNQLNLHGPWPLTQKFDAIFCRNVVIYFDKPAQCRLFERFANQMRDGGFLYIGHSESLHQVSTRFRPVGQSIYQKIAG